MDDIFNIVSDDYVYRCRYNVDNPCTWWRHQMETFSALLAICAENSPVSGKFPAQRPVTRSFEVFFDLRLDELLSKHSWCWWLETPLCPLWRHSNDTRQQGLTTRWGRDKMAAIFQTAFWIYFLGHQKVRFSIQIPLIIQRFVSAFPINNMPVLVLILR